MLIRTAELSDLSELCGLFDLYRQFYAQDSDVEGAQTFIKERLNKRDSVFFVADAHGKLQGFTQLYPLFSSTKMKKQWVLNDLYVRMEARRLGVAEKLLRTAMDFGTMDSSRGLSLQTAVTNLSAQRLYERLGWKKNETFLTYTFYSQS